MARERRIIRNQDCLQMRPRKPSTKTFAFVLQLGNAAFDPDPAPEIARLLRDAADRVEAGWTGEHTAGALKDSNGNTVGTYEQLEV